MKFLKNLFVCCFLLGSVAHARIGGFNLTDADGYPYDAAPEGQPATPAQKAVDQIKRLGGRHVILNLRGTMVGPFANEVQPMTAPADRPSEAQRLLRLIKYIKSQGLTVGLRPIFFVVGPHGEFPYVEKKPDGSQKTWWHGNIQPSDPERWFESFRNFLDLYLRVAKVAKVDEFTIGAELYSMTVGIEDQWKQFPYGFPGRWLELLRYVRSQLPQARLMYDINFTDDSNTESGFAKSGGELERWRYRLVDLADPANPEEKKIWQDLVDFWKELDAVGIDMYRSLASPNQTLPKEQKQLLELLKSRADTYATQLDNAMGEITLVVGVEKKAIFKEIGYRSVEKGFIDPFNYSTQSGALNLEHQEVAYAAFFKAFWEPGWSWFEGVMFWDISVNPSLTGPQDRGFSPLGKEQTENLIQNYFRTTNGLFLRRP